jgi:ATP-binding cassette, subfamily C, bacterial
MVRLLASLYTYAPRRVLLVLLMTLGLSVTSGASLLMLVPMLGIAGLDVGQGSIGRLGEIVTAGFALLGLPVTIPAVIGVYLLVVTVDAWFSRTQAMRTAVLYQGYAMHLRRRTYGAITRSRWSYYASHKSSDFVHLLTQEIERVSGAASGIITLAAKTILAVIYLGVALFLSPLTTLLVLACGGVLVALLARKTRLGRAKGEAVSAAYQEMYGAISEHLAGMRISKSHGTESQHVERFGDRAARAAHAITDVTRNQSDLSFWLQIASAAILASIFYLALVVLALPLASILLLLYLFARLVPIVTGLQRGVQSVLNLLPAVDRMNDVLARLDVQAEAQARGPAVPAPTLRHEMRFERVGFGYAGPTDGVIVHGIDLVIRAGQTTAVVGPSGAGKSTVADLVVGLLTPSQGRITIDGVPLEGAVVHAWRRRIGYVNQDTFLFNDTIRENLRSVRERASDEEMIAALRAAAADFALALPEGLDTVVGDRGVRLSGGERQRIALARALLRGPAMLILDEATSALDAENEGVIQRAIEAMAGRQTILVISHRLASVRSADVIHVMDGGRIVESGSWESLIDDEHGRFRALCQAQGVVVTPPAGRHAAS